MATQAPAGIAEEVLNLVRTLALELHPGRRGLAGATLDSSLEKDFGLDSLARAELLQRLERAFGHRLPEALLSSAETPRDLLDALRSGASGSALSTALVEEPSAPAEP